jgi:hypothetical protein
LVGRDRAGGSAAPLAGHVRLERGEPAVDADAVDAARAMRGPGCALCRAAGPQRLPSGGASGDADLLAAQGDDVATPQPAPAAGLDLAVDANRTVFDQRAASPPDPANPARYGDLTRETAADARRNLLDAAVELGAHLDAAEGHVDDEMIVRALSAFMDARQCYLASLGAPNGITLNSGPPSMHSRHSVHEVARRFGLTA